MKDAAYEKVEHELRSNLQGLLRAGRSISRNGKVGKRREEKMSGLK